MNTKDLRKLLSEGKLLVGLEQARKSLQNKTSSRIFFAQNAPEQEVAFMRDYAEMADTEMVALDVSNHQLGTMCRKQFAISFLAEKK